MELVVNDLAERNFSDSLFDFDVSVVHITHEKSLDGYFYNLPKISRDSKLALENGRTIILLPESENFLSRRTISHKGTSVNISKTETGMAAYEWVKINMALI